MRGRSIPQLATNISIRQARSTEARVLSGIAMAAKKSWGYPDHWLDLWGDMLNITPDFIENNHVWVATTTGNTIVGFVAISIADDIAEVEHLWIQPQAMRQGIGNALFRHCLDHCTTHNLKMIRIESDPNARGFYEKFGAKPAGQVNSIPAPRVLPVLTIEL
jgi:ribosomal protein S18 acetylase RimI-like enzyme